MTWMLDAVHRSMRLSTLMTSTLQILSGVLIFTMAAISISLWYNNAITTGAIAFAIGLTLRIKAMSQWIIWEVASLFEDVGVIQDGVETIARERSIKDAEDARPLVVSRGEIRFEDVTFDYGRVSTGARPHRGRSPEPHHQAGREGGSRRAFRRGQVDAGQSAAALLRPAAGPHPDRRTGYRQDDAGFAARRDRRGDAGHLAAAPFGDRQHPLRQSRREHGRRRGGSPQGPCRRVHRASCRSEGAEGLRRACRRARREALGRAAPAHRHRARAAQERADPGARRGHQRARTPKWSRPFRKISTR